ncbi:3-deoxy-8-phosphooctulonate synthase [Candidatus Uhrbacteria bacterium]|nr:3-deoxy-8-phosphooctulonate synthase [Candidatus Uhrbacteria bacterium]
MKDEKTWILGPCAIEDRDTYIEAARELYGFMNGRDWYFKGSFDKANRTSVHGQRGVGLEKALEYFREVKDSYPGIKLTTDVHETQQVEPLAQVIDLIQVPAFLCRQTDLLVECGRHFDKVNVKKGQWINPQNAVHFKEKVTFKNKDASVWLTERGTFFGYQQLTVDFSNIPLFKQHFDKVILDTTHSTQFVEYGFTLGDRNLAERYILSSGLFGYDGVFAEVHPEPEKAITDGKCMIYMDRIKELVEVQEKIDGVYRENIGRLLQG